MCVCVSTSASVASGSAAGRSILTPALRPHALGLAKSVCVSGFKPFPPWTGGVDTRILPQVARMAQCGEAEAESMSTHRQQGSNETQGEKPQWTLANGSQGQNSDCMRFGTPWPSGAERPSATLGRRSPCSAKVARPLRTRVSPVAPSEGTRSGPKDGARAVRCVCCAGIGAQARIWAKIGGASVDTCDAAGATSARNSERPSLYTWNAPGRTRRSIFNRDGPELNAPATPHPTQPPLRGMGASRCCRALERGRPAAGCARRNYGGCA